MRLLDTGWRHWMRLVRPVEIPLMFVIWLGCVVVLAAGGLPTTLAWCTTLLGIIAGITFFQLVNQRGGKR